MKIILVPKPQNPKTPKPRVVVLWRNCSYVLCKFKLDLKLIYNIARCKTNKSGLSLLNAQKSSVTPRTLRVRPGSKYCRSTAIGSAYQDGSTNKDNRRSLRATTIIKSKSKSVFAHQGSLMIAPWRALMTGMQVVVLPLWQQVAMCKEALK